MYCEKCGTIIDKNVSFCPYCGSRLVEEPEGLRERINLAATDGYDIIDQHEEKHKMEGRKAAAIAYLGWLGFFIAILQGDLEDALLKFHINQDSTVNVAGIILLLLPIPQFLLVIIVILLFGAAIYGMYEAINRREVGIPYISSFKFIK